MERTLENLVTDNVFSRSQIEDKTRLIHDSLLRQSRHLREPNFRSIHPHDLEKLFELYDELFFEGFCQREFQSPDQKLSFRLSKRMTSAGGMTSCKRHRLGRNRYRTQYEITVAMTLLFETFSSSVKRPIFVAGIVCKDRLEALQRVFEHELVHLLEMLVWNESSCRQRRFQNLVDRIFAHTDVVHRLITPQEKAHVEFGLRAGDQVTFDMDGINYQGKINRITKRATVLVKDRQGQLYSDGHRYAKFYVPLAMLRGAES